MRIILAALLLLPALFAQPAIRPQCSATRTTYCTPVVNRSGAYVPTVSGGSGIAPYSYTFTGQTTVTRTSAQHGFATANLLVAVYDASGNLVQPNSIAVDPSTYAVTVTFGTAQTGVLVINGGTGPKGDTGTTGAAGSNGTNGSAGTAGTNGTNGTNGQGVPTGGTTGQVLSKTNGTDYNTQWANSMTQAIANSAANTVSVSVGTSGTAFAKTPVTIDPSTGAIAGGKIATAAAADTATALAANGANCTATQFATGVDASGAAEGCAVPPGTYTLPAATASTAGGVTLTAAAQKFFGTAAPGSVTGNLPGDFFTDTTAHNEYVCNAPSGTAAPACTSVTSAGWLLVNVPATVNPVTSSSNITDLYSVIGDGGAKGVKVGPAIAQAATVSTIAERDSAGALTATGFISTPAGGVAGFGAFPQGTANSAPTSSVGFQAPTSVSSAFLFTLPGAPAVGLLHATNATPSVLSASAVVDGDLSGQVGVAHGGTGLSTWTAHALYVGNTTSAPTAIGPDASTTKALFSAGASADPAYRAIATGDLPTLTAALIPATPVSIAATTHTMVAPREYFLCTTATACSVTLPVPAAGYEFCVRSDNNVSTAITLAARTSIYYEKTDRTGWGSSGGTLVSGAAVTNQICVIGYDATHYAVMSSAGTWTSN